MPRIRGIALGLWVILVVALTTLYAVNPGLLQPEALVDVLRQSGQPVLLAYVVLSIVRAFTLIPSTVAHHRWHAAVSGSARLRDGELARGNRGSLRRSSTSSSSSSALESSLKGNTLRGCAGSRARCARKGFWMRVGVVGVSVCADRCDLLCSRHPADARRDVPVRCGARRIADRRLLRTRRQQVVRRVVSRVTTAISPVSMVVGYINPISRAWNATESRARSTRAPRSSARRPPGVPGRPARPGGAART